MIIVRIMVRETTRPKDNSPGQSYYRRILHDTAGYRRIAQDTAGLLRIPQDRKIHQNTVPKYPDQKHVLETNHWI